MQMRKAGKKLQRPFNQAIKSGESRLSNRPKEEIIHECPAGPDSPVREKTSNIYDGSQFHCRHGLIQNVNWPIVSVVQLGYPFTTVAE